MQTFKTALMDLIDVYYDGGVLHHLQITVGDNFTKPPPHTQHTYTHRYTRCQETNEKCGKQMG